MCLRLHNHVVGFRWIQSNRGLKIVQQGKNLSHFEIIPNKALSLSQYQTLLDKVALIGI